MIPISSIANTVGTGAGQAASAGSAARAAQSGASSGTGSDLFSDTFHSAAREIGKLDTDAQSAVTGLLNGQGVEVHDAMIATQKSELAFQLALQVRNKAVSAYQQMMQMQF